jgi:hypothetical protein
MTLRKKEPDTQEKPDFWGRTCGNTRTSPGPQLGAVERGASGRIRRWFD